MIARCSNSHLDASRDIEARKTRDHNHKEGEVLHAWTYTLLVGVGMGACRTQMDCLLSMFTHLFLFYIVFNTVFCGFSCTFLLKDGKESLKKWDGTVSRWGRRDTRNLHNTW